MSGLPPSSRPSRHTTPTRRRRCSPTRATGATSSPFTWNITTVEGGSGVADLLRATLDDVDPVGFRVTEEPAEEDGVITAWIAFETKAGRGSGLLRLVGGKAFTLLTTLDELKGHEEPVNDRRPNGVRHGAFRDRVTWAESRAREATELGYTLQPEVLIIGGGQGGIALGARLRQLGVPVIIVERNERPGDSWRKRYKSLALHDPVRYDHLPYFRSRRTGRCSRRRTRSATGSRCNEGHGAQLLGLDDLQVRGPRG